MARGWGKEEMESNYLIVTGFPFGVMKCSELDRGGPYTTLSKYKMPLNYSLYNGYFYVE